MTPEEVAKACSALSGEAVLEVHRLVGGSSRPSWRVTTAAGVYAVRFYPDAPPVHGQARLFDYLKRQGFPVPGVAFAGSHEVWHVLALEWLGGLTVAEALRAHPERARQLGQAFGKTHAQLHTVPVTPEMQQSLPVLGPEGRPTPPALIHLDFHLLNVLTDGETVLGVIDWENVRLGDARHDVARTLSILCADPSVRALPEPLRRAVRTFRRGYVEGYRSRAGSGSLAELSPFLAWAGAFMLRDLEGRLEPLAAGTLRRWSERFWSEA